MTDEEAKKPCNQPMCAKCLILIDKIFGYEHAVYEVGIIPKKCAFCNNDACNTLDVNNATYYIICENLENWYDEHD